MGCREEEQPDEARPRLLGWHMILFWSRLMGFSAFFMGMLSSVGRNVMISLLRDASAQTKVQTWAYVEANSMDLI